MPSFSPGHRGRVSSPARAITLAICLVAPLGCSIPIPKAIPADPGVTFAAHGVRGGLMVDAMQDGTPTPVLEPDGIDLLGHTTSFVKQGPAQGEAVTICGPGCASVRRTENGEVVGRILPDWEDNAIRLNVDTQQGHFTTDLFTRDDFRGGLSTLARWGQMTIDVTGIYKAAVRDAQGRQVGWFSVKIPYYGASYPIYEAVLPKGIDEGVATGMAAALGAEVSWIEYHLYDPTYGGAVMEW